MNPYYDYHHTILQPPYYAYGVPISPAPAPAPWVVYDQVIPVHHTMGIFYPPSLQYVYGVVILNTPNNNTMWVNQEPMHSYQRPEDTYIHEFEAFLEERLIMHELGLVDPAPQRRTVGTSGSGLSEEEISKHLHVYIAQGKMSANCEADTCSICLGEFEKKEKMGRLECGHRYHAECIKRWLLSKNVCPMCRSTALRV